ncbi:MAG: hypothetical protein LBQ15_02045 [Clostridium sp.]|jgi:Cys-tRNA(Pro)/Cys-tRNA(Cys) deacylase|nr:hypothetical protein [Clostridium sp.]
MSGLYERFIKLLEDHKARYEIMEHIAISNTQEGIAALGIPLESAFKTLAFVANGKYFFVVIQGGKRMDYKKLATALGVDRKSISMMPQDIVEELGYQAGGLSPLHVDHRISVYFDGITPEMGDIYVGMAVKDKTLKIGASALIAISNAEIVSLTKD